MNRKSLLIIIAMVTGLSVWAQSVGLEASPVSISSAPLNARYHRPAGAFFTHITAVDGVAQYNQVSDEFIMLKPYSDYTFHALADGIGPDAQFLWRCYDDFGWEIYECNTRDLTVNNGPGRQQTPWLHVRDGSATSSFQWYNPSLGWAQVICPIMMVTAVNPSQVTDQEGVVEAVFMELGHGGKILLIVFRGKDLLNTCLQPVSDLPELVLHGLAVKDDPVFHPGFRVKEETLAFPETVVLSFIAADDHMVKDVDVHDLSSIDQFFCEELIFPAGSQLTTGVIVKEHDAGSIAEDGRLKDILNGHDSTVHISDADHVIIDL